MNNSSKKSAICPYLHPKKAYSTRNTVTKCYTLSSSPQAVFNRWGVSHWKRVWCWEGLGAGGEWDDRGWDGWMASLTRWTWVSVNSGSWWWTGRPGVLWFMGLQRVGHDWATDLIWSIGLLVSFTTVCNYRQAKLSLVLFRSWYYFYLYSLF